jgi:DNA-binding transcriptional ArsR family regulator
MSNARERMAADVFFALGDGTRLWVVGRLAADGALSATTLAQGATVTRQAIAKHLQVLSVARLVTQEKRGRDVMYTLEPRGLDEARVFLEGISARWDRALDRLRQLVEEPVQPRRRQPPPRGSLHGRRRRD